MFSSNSVLKNNIFLILVFFTISFTSFGQYGFRDGYYITLENDTIHGLIDYKGEIKNSENCSYKKDKESKPIQLSPGEIHSYRFKDSKYYISKKVNTGTKEEVVFVEFLVNGISNLYYLQGLYSNLYFIEDEKGNILKLEDKTETIHVGNGEVLKNSYRHINLLKAQFADCMEIQPQLNTAKLTHKSLIDITKKYHAYVSDNEEYIVYEKLLPAIKVQFGPVGGTTITNLDFFIGSRRSEFTYDKNQNLTYGVQLNTILPRAGEKVSFQMEFLFNQNDYYGTYRTYYNLVVKNTMFQSSYAFKYTHPRGKIRPSLAGGAVMNKLLNLNMSVDIYDPLKPSKTQTLEIDGIDLTPNLYGWFVQLGCNFQTGNGGAIFTNIKYSKSVGTMMQRQGATRTTISLLNFSVGFYFGKME